MPYPNQIPNIIHTTFHATDPATAGTATPAATSASGLVIVIVLLVLLVAGVAALIIWLKLRARQKARIAAMSPAERERYDAVAEYQAGVAGAQKALGEATSARTARLRAAEKALGAAHAIGIRATARYRGKDGSASITSTEIQTGHGTFPLTAGVNATVDTAGNLATSSRSTFTRVAAGGLLFGPVGAIVGGVAKKTKLHDSRELYLLLEGESFAVLISCNPDDGAAVRRFAVAVKQAALQAETARAQRASAVATAERALAIEQQNTAPVDAARAALNRATANTARVDAATRALEA